MRKILTDAKLLLMSIYIIFSIIVNVILALVEAQPDDHLVWKELYILTFIYCFTCYDVHDYMVIALTVYGHCWDFK